MNSYWTTSIVNQHFDAKRLFAYGEDLHPKYLYRSTLLALWGEAVVMGNVAKDELSMNYIYMQCPDSYKLFMNHPYVKILWEYGLDKGIVIKYYFYNLKIEGILNKINTFNEKLFKKILCK